MLSERVFRSDDLPAADRIEAWRQWTGGKHELSREHMEGFRVHQRIFSLGEMTVSLETFQHLVHCRTPKLVRSQDPEMYKLVLVLDGEVKIAEEGRGTVYRPLDMRCNDSARPYGLWSGHVPVTSVAVGIPKASLLLPRSRTDRLTGSRLTGREGTGALLAQFLSQVVKDTGSYRPADAPRLGTVLNGLITTVFADSLDAEACLPPETRTRTRTLRIQDFIRRHLDDPGLTPGAIADAHHISRSYLHRLFQDESDTVAGYIRRLRLEAARRDLADPAWRATPVQAIAARWGFPRASDFSRAFRAAYEIPPTHYREAALRAGGAR
jgi:AraC-like DNA-binding protein